MVSATLDGMATPNPWRDLAARPDVVVIYAPLPPGMSGATDGRRIYLHHRLRQRERRCTLAHELVHLERGDATCQPPAVERTVRRETARRLLPDVGLIGDVLAWAADEHQASEELWVTTRVLRDRLDALHPSERAHLTARLADR